MMMKTYPAVSTASRQSGISLLVVLILLVVTSVLGIAVLRSSAMQERMGANMRDRSLAFQAAEAALRLAQDQLAAAPNPVASAGETWDTRIPNADNCTNQGICNTGATPVWIEAPALTSGNIVTTSQYWIEYLGTGPGYRGSCDTVPPSIDCKSPMFRITTRSPRAGVVGRASVTLQSNVVSRIPTPGS